jgi:transposase
MTLVTELHDFRRFRRPRELMSYLGLIPSEHSSGGRTQRGGITKTGNGHARRILIECAWHYRHQARVSRALQQRREGQPARVIAIADKAHRRLSGRYRRMTTRGKEHNKVVVAIARELVGFLWATLAVEERAAVK